ncbi:MAG: gliding motility-associated C-terminal domain-containing protein [Bacteroidales bacterium]|nr:gliding motility-associated C-terminal domain-containing protein [Bacteroidales bacterium]
MSNRLKNRFENFEEAPQKEAWDNIKSQIPKPKFNWLAIFTISGVAILVFGIFILYISTPTKSDKEDILISNNTNISKVKTESIEKTIIDNDIKAIVINRVDKDKKAMLIDNNESSDNNLVKSNNTNQTNSNFISTEKKIQIKENENSSSKIANPFLISSIKPLSKANQSIDNKNTIEEKIIESGYDTISTIRELFIPNAFTPNDINNNNTTFKPAYKKLKTYEMKIFNRTGVLLFTSKDISIGWNGYYQGRLCEMGTYAYVIKCEYMDGYIFGKDGVVNLIR